MIEPLEEDLIKNFEKYDQEHEPSDKLSIVIEMQYIIVQKINEIVDKVNNLRTYS